MQTYRPWQFYCNFSNHNIECWPKMQQNDIDKRWSNWQNYAFVA